MTLDTHKLSGGYIYKPVISGLIVDFDSDFITHINYAENSADRLSSNYTLFHIAKMQEYGYIYDKHPGNLVFMVGLENFHDNAYRIESRLFVHHDYRTKLWRSPDNYESVKHQINNHIHSCDFLFKSRTAKNPAGFLISRKLNDYFDDWLVYRNQIELRYKDNHQLIMYKTIKGNTNDHISKLLFKI